MGIFEAGMPAEHAGKADQCYKWQNHFLTMLPALRNKLNPP